MDDQYPILEFDPDPESVIDPSKVIKHRDVSEFCVMTFFLEVIENIKTEIAIEPLQPFKSEMGEIPIYAARYRAKKFTIIPAGVGASFAAAQLEEMIARGGRKFVVCGGAGVLERTIASGDIVVPTAAIRDEGTSYHYLPPSREAYPTAHVVDTILETLKEHNCSYVTGKTWTTDAFYRETRGKIARRKEEGCLTVEMEAAALFAVAQFRGVAIGQLLYGGDDVSGIEWDAREHGQKISVREKIFWLAVESCLKL